MKKLALVLLLGSAQAATPIPDFSDFLTNPSHALPGPFEDAKTCPYRPGAPMKCADAANLDPLRQGLEVTRTFVLSTEQRLADLEAAFAAFASKYPQVPPDCVSFSPSSASVGGDVVLSGSGLGALTAVSVNGVSASRQIQSDGQVTITVPQGATSGSIAVWNAVGTDTCPGTLTVASGAPGAPTSLASSNVTSSSLALSWSAATGSPTSYTATLAKDANGVPSSTLAYSGSISGEPPATAVTIEGLDAATKYWARVKATNATGDGPWSAYLAATTLGGSYPPTQTPLVKYTQPTVALPALGGAITNVFGSLDSTYDTRTRRVVDRRHHYSKMSPFNADETLALSGITGQGWVHAVTTTGAYTETLDIDTPEAMPAYRAWSNVDSSYGYGLSTVKTWMKWRASGDHDTLKTYAASDFGTTGTIYNMSWGGNEGTLDRFDTGAVLHADTSDDATNNPTFVALINPTTGAVRCNVTAASGASDGYGAAIEDSGMAQNGAYFVVSYTGYGMDAYDADDCSWKGKVSTSYTSHYDTCVSSDNRQVVVQASGSTLRMYDIEAATPTSVAPYTVVYSDSAMRIHTSCRNVKRPGWVYVNVYNDNCDATTQAMNAYQRIFAVKLDGSKTVENWAWDHQPCPSSYDLSANAVPSPSGTKVWWKGGWGTDTGFNYSYVAEKP